MCWPRFIVFKSLAWAVTEPCASDQRFIAIWNWSGTPVQWAQQVWGPQVLITARSRWISLLLLANEGISIGMVVMKGSSSSSQIKCEHHKASKRGIRPCLEIFVWTVPIKFGESNHEIGARKYDCWQWKGPPKQDSRSCHQICSNSMSPWVRQLENKKLKNTMNEVWRWNEVSWYKPRSGAFLSTYQRPWLHKHLPRRCSLKAVKGRFISLLGAAQPTQMFHSKHASVA